jgi:cell division protein FtsQ
MRGRAVLSPREVSSGFEDLASRHRLMRGQRVDRYRLRRRAARRARWIMGRLAIALIALGVVGAAATGVGWLLASPRFAVASVDVAGQKHVSLQEIEAAAGVASGTNIFKVDPREVAARVERLSGIRRASVVRMLPNRVAIRVEERRRFALVHAGQLHWIDEEGMDLGPEPRPVALGLPLITGIEPEELDPADRDASSRLLTGLALLRVLMRSGGGLLASISEIDMSRREGPVLYTVDGVEVRLGNEDWEARLGRLAGVTAQLKASGDAVASIDLRFRDQIVLKDRGK